MWQAGIPQEAFDFIHTLEDIPAAKPDPRALGPALEKLAPLVREEVVYVGDRPDDARAARGAGVGFVGVLTGTNGPACFERAGVERHALLDSVRGLPCFLRKAVVGL
jgi:phosphoglycolate phosphatase